MVDKDKKTEDIEETTEQNSAEPEEEQEKETVEEEVKEKKPKKKNFLQTKRGGQIASIIAGIVVLAIIVFVEGPAEPITFGFTPLKFLGILSIVLSMFVTLVYKFMTDQVLMRELKGQLKIHQKQMRDCRDNPTKMSEISKKSMSVNMKYMSQSMKPMLITLLPFLLIFHWLRGMFDGIIVLPLSFWPGHLGWIGVYIIFSMVFTTVFRKLLNVV
jgi:uncharacterized membrane protein (DUF106 family)